MKRLAGPVSLICVGIFLCVILMTRFSEGGKDKAPTASEEAQRVYPIAPGVWYPGDGPIPEKPMRYYRVRCWPGCHRGSAHGKYPKEPLDMKPIYPTSTVKQSPD